MSDALFRGYEQAHYLAEQERELANKYCLLAKAADELGLSEEAERLRKASEEHLQAWRIASYDASDWRSMIREKYEPVDYGQED